MLSTPPDRDRLRARSAMFSADMRLNNICGCCSVQLSIDNLPDRSAAVFEGKLLAVEDF